MTHTPCRALPPDGRFLAQLGPTPLVPVRLDPDGPAIWCKLEFLNPSGSTKDRIARHMLEKAWRQGALGPGDTVAEPPAARPASPLPWPAPRWAFGSSP
jgi:cysteine synthase A